MRPPVLVAGFAAPALLPSVSPSFWPLRPGRRPARIRATSSTRASPASRRMTRAQALHVLGRRHVAGQAPEWCASEFGNAWGMAWARGPQCRDPIVVVLGARGGAGTKPTAIGWRDRRLEHGPGLLLPAQAAARCRLRDAVGGRGLHDVRVQQPVLRRRRSTGDREAARGGDDPLPTGVRTRAGVRAFDSVGVPVVDPGLVPEATARRRALR